MFLRSLLFPLSLGLLTSACAPALSPPSDLADPSSQAAQAEQTAIAAGMFDLTGSWELATSDSKLTEVWKLQQSGNVIAGTVQDYYPGMTANLQPAPRTVYGQLSPGTMSRTFVLQAPAGTLAIDQSGANLQYCASATSECLRGTRLASTPTPSPAPSSAPAAAPMSPSPSATVPSASASPRPRR